ncbi:MAG: AgmX/PglI C-terminal domain-containing protein [Myxococcales bacterium]|nr:AgmX/PglI C-terminal domain-containing protein [Myxococcales bacterium]
MAQAGNPKILRVGIIQNNEFIEERLLRKRHSVTIGQASGNTFSVPSSSLPRQFALFELKGGQYHLNIRPGMSGKVAVDDQPLDFDALRGKGLARPSGTGDGQLSMALSEGHRGRVVVGDVTFLFQFVTPPPPPSRLQLPAAVRGGLVRSLDWPFVTTVLASFVVQVFSIAFIVTRDYPEPPRGIDALPDRFVRMLEADVKPPEVKKEEVSDEKKDEEKDPDKVEEKVEKVEPKKAVERSPEEVAKKVEKARVARVRNNTILKFIGTNGGDGEGSIVDTLKSGAIDLKMAEAFDGASGLQVADSEDQVRDRRMAGLSGTGRVAGIDNDALRAKDTGPVETGAKREVAVKGSVELKRLRDDDVVGTGVLSPASIASVVGRRKSAIKSCYEKQLRHNSKLAGKVRIQFTIEQSGRVSSVKVVEDTLSDPLVGKCIANAVQRFRFDKPDGGSVTVAFPFVFAPSS